MLKKELKSNFKSFIIWLVILISIFLVVFLIYPSIVGSENVQMIDEMMKIFPKEMLMAFNMDISSIDSAYGWLKTEGFVFVLLIIGCYSGILATSILLKEESDKTIEYLNCLPVKRNNIVINKVIVGIVYIISMVLLLGLFNFIALILSGDFNTKQYVLLSITPIITSMPMFFLCLFVSTLVHRTKKMLGISLLFVLISYIFQTLTTLSSSVEFLKYFSLFTLADIRNVIVNVSINPIMVIISLSISILFFSLTLISYNKKEFV